MGGTFNPIHQGHLILAEQAYEQFDLDQVLFMPSKNPPHKNKMDLLSDEHRNNMIRLAIEDNPHFTLSTFELEREGTTYTADTLCLLTEQNPDTCYFFFVGADSLFMMQNWKAPQTIFRLCKVIVAGRDTTKRKLIEHANILKEKFQGEIFIMDMPSIEISSRMIRDKLVDNKTIRYFVPDKVFAYINENQLYRIRKE